MAAAQLSGLPEELIARIAWNLPTDYVGTLVRACRDFYLLDEVRLCLAKRREQLRARLLQLCSSPEVNDHVRRYSPFEEVELDLLATSSSIAILVPASGGAVGSAEVRMLAYLLASGALPQLTILHMTCLRASCDASAAHALVAAVATAGCRLSWSCDHAPPGARRAPRWPALAPGVRALDASRCGLSDADATVITATLSFASATLLQELSLAQNHISGAGGVALAAALAAGHARGLRSLNLQANLLDDAAGVSLASALHATPELRHLHLQSNALADDALCAFAAVLGQETPPITPWLKHLSLNANAFTPAAERALHAAVAFRASAAANGREHARLRVAARAPPPARAFVAGGAHRQMPTLARVMRLLSMDDDDVPKEVGVSHDRP